MPTPIRQLILITLLFYSFVTFAQNSPLTVEQIRTFMNEDYAKVNADKAKRNLHQVNVFKTEVRKIWTGADSISIQINYPSDKPNLPILYNVHGGAFAWAPALDMSIARVLCMSTGSVVVSVDYRLPPEHPFPAPINDAYAVWNWIDQNAERIQGNRQKITLIGDSAGGLFLGALQVKRQQEASSLRPLALVFINPAIDLRSTAAGVDHYRLVVNSYLHCTDPNSPLASPILSPTLKDYPTSLIIVSEKDDLKPHGVILADKLKEAGVTTQLISLPDKDHLGHTWLSAHPYAQPAVDAVISFINTTNGQVSK